MAFVRNPAALGTFRDLGRPAPLRPDQRRADDQRELGQLLHGGWGYAEEYPISRYVADAQVLPIFEGVKPILALKVVGRSLLAR
jgi:hypothetical protein